MFYTLAQAEPKLARFADGGASDVRSAINDALEQLSSMSLWRDMRRTIRISVQNEVLPLPQNVESILRVTVDGNPSQVFGTDYQFVEGGVGDLDWENNSGLGLSDYGAGHCVQFDINPDKPGKLFAVSADPRDNAKEVTVTGILEDGTDSAESIKVRRWTGDVGNLDFNPLKITGADLYEVTRVVLPSGLQGWVSLYMTDGTDVFFLAKYHPDVLVPEFRRYRVNWTLDADVPSQVLAEVRIRFMPLVSSGDVIPFNSLAAVQYMMQAVKEFNAGNMDGGANYQALAMARMSEKDTARSRAQGLAVENVLTDVTAGGSSFNGLNYI